MKLVVCLFIILLIVERLSEHPNIFKPTLFLNVKDVCYKTSHQLKIILNYK